MAATSRRRWRWGLLAGALIVAGGAAGAWAGLASDETRTVAVLNADLPAGHMITAADVTSVDLAEAEGLRLLTPEVAEGMVLTRPVPAGSPLVAGSVSDSALWPEPGQAVVAVPVTTVPADLREGTTVDLVAVAAHGQVPEAEEEDAEGSSAQSPSGVVTGLVHRVVASDEDGFGDGQQAVEVVLPRDQAAHFSRAAAGEEIQVLVVNPHEDAQAVAESEGAE
ncbi:hypothetical protein A6A08_21240 [Nocardiopsis sp. TSRI0078]|nr:hypothetical protein A6A08_21240 [Nocardiopsis sp. TSRI0078]